MKTLQEMTTEELAGLKRATYEVAREQSRMLHEGGEFTGRRAMLAGSLCDTMSFLNSINGELIRRGA